MRTKVWKLVESRFAMRRPLGSLVVVALSVIILTVSLVPTSAQEGEKKVSIDQVPAEVKAAILKQVGDGKLVDIGEFTKGEKKLYEIEMVVGGKEFDVLFSSDGKVLRKTFEGLKAKEGEAEAGEIERQVTEVEVPKAALAALTKMAAGAVIYEFAEEIEHGSTFYEGSWKKPSGANVDVIVTPTGDLVEIEEQVSADQVPAATLKTARKAAGRKAKLAFEKKTMILYEVKFQKGGLGYELLLSPDGRRVEEEVTKGKPD
ncbi:MAG: PepSY-like domain-containing protein [Sedimentisphaerales bacterium]